MALAISEIDEYLALQAPEAQAKLSQIRAWVHEIAPGGEEAISYGIPTFRLKHQQTKSGNFIHLAAFASHVSLYPRTKAIEEHFGDRLKPYASGKGTLKFSLDQDLPEDFLREVIKVRLKEHLGGPN